MIVQILKIELIYFLRKFTQQGSVFLNVLTLFFSALFIAYLLAIGFYADIIVAQLFPEQDKLSLCLTGMSYYFIGDFFLRIFFQKTTLDHVQLWSLMPVKGFKILAFYLIRSLQSYFSLIPLLLFSPFIVKVIEGSWAKLHLAALLLTAVVVMHYFILLLKLKKIEWVYLIVLVGLLLEMVWKVEWLWYPAQALNTFLQLCLDRPAAGVGLIGMVALLIALNYLHLRSVYRYAEAQGSPLSRKQDLHGNLNSNRNIIWTLCLLEFRMLFRNRRPRIILLASSMYPLIISYNIYSFSDSFLFLYGAILMTSGYLGLMYGQLIFSWDGTYFETLITRTYPRNILWSKYVIICLMSLLGFILSLPLGFLFDDLIRIACYSLLYNISFGALIQLFFATMNTVRFDINGKATMNFQGAKLHQLFAILPFALFPIIWLWISDTLGYLQEGLWVLAGLEIILLFSMKYIFGYLHRAFQYRKFKMLEGFRSTI